MRIFFSLLRILELVVIIGGFRYAGVTQKIFDVAVALGFIFLMFRFSHSAILRKKDLPIALTVFLLFLNVVSSAVNANYQTDQPIIYGLLSQRNLFTIGIGIFLAHKLEKGRISMSFIRKTIYFVGALNFFLLLLREVPSSHGFLEFIGARTIDLGNGALYPIMPSTSAFLAILVLLARTLQRRHLFGFLGAICGALVVTSLQGGIINILASIITTSFIISLCVRGVSKIPALLMRFYVILWFAYLALSITIATDHMPDWLYQTLALISGGEDATNFSFLARIDQLNIVRENGLFFLMTGYGSLSNQWMGGLASRFEYFHPSDLGLIGVLFVYGILGAYLFLHIALLASREIRSVRIGASAERIAFNGLLLYLIISSLATGQLVFQAEVGLTVLAFACAMRDAEDQLAKRSRLGFNMISKQIKREEF